MTGAPSGGERWLAGNVGGAVLVGDTVRRPTGPWTPAVHALLDHLASRVPTLVGHNDIAPYNVCFDGDDLAGVFDWDLAGPTTPLLELAFIAWNCVPLWRDTGHREAAHRLGVIASGYGGFSARQVLHAVPGRIRAMLDGIPRAAAAGDRGMANLVAQGEPERSRASLTALVARIPAIDGYLP